MPAVRPTASAVSSAAASGSATLSAMRAAMRARSVSTDACASASRALSAAGRTRPVRCTRSRKRHARGVDAGEVARLGRGDSRTSQRQRSPTRGATRRLAPGQARAARASVAGPVEQLHLGIEAPLGAHARRHAHHHALEQQACVVTARLEAQRLPFVAGLQRERACHASNSARQRGHGATAAVATTARRPPGPAPPTTGRRRAFARRPVRRARRPEAPTRRSRAAARDATVALDATRIFPTDHAPQRDAAQPLGAQPFKRFLRDPRLWSLQRRTVTPAFGAGLAICFVPLPIHIPLAALVAIFCRIHIPTIMLSLLAGESAHRRAGLLPRLQGRRAGHRRARAHASPFR